MNRRSLTRDLRESLRHPEFWAYSSWLDLVVRYRRTQLGVIWVFLAFFLFVVVMGYKFAYLMNTDPRTFLPYLAVGYMTWRFIVTVINDAVGTLATHRSFIMDGRVRLTDYLLRSIAKASFHFLFAALVVALVLVWSGHYSPLGLLSLLITFPMLAVVMFWVALGLGLLGARFTDTHEVVGTVLMVVFLLTPIIWEVDKFPAGTVRGSLTRLNPAFHLVEVVRAPILGRMPEFDSVIFVGVLAVAGWVIASLVYRRYAHFVPLWV